MSSSRCRKGIKRLLRILLANPSYELTTLCQKHNLTSVITLRVANNFLQVICNLKNQYSHDVTGKYLYYYYFKYFSLLSNTIYNMNSVEIMGNKLEII